MLQIARQQAMANRALHSAAGLWMQTSPVTRARLPARSAKRPTTERTCSFVSMFCTILMSAPASNGRAGECTCYYDTCGVQVQVRMCGRYLRATVVDTDFHTSRHSRQASDALYTVRWPCQTIYIPKTRMCTAA